MKMLTLVVLALLLAACATSGDNASTARAPEEKVYKSGSRLPIRDPVQSSPSATVDPSTLHSATPTTRTN